MKFVDNLREKPAVKKIEKFAPAIAFLGGFGWDSITLGQMVESSDLVFLVAYYTGALILVILLSARLEHPEGWTKDRLRAAAAAQAKAAPAQAAPEEKSKKKGKGKIAPEAPKDESDKAPVVADENKENGENA